MVSRRGWDLAVFVLTVFVLTVFVLTVFVLTVFVLTVFVLTVLALAVLTAGFSPSVSSSNGTVQMHLVVIMVVICRRWHGRGDMTAEVASFIGYLPLTLPLGKVLVTVVVVDDSSSR